MPDQKKTRASELLDSLLEEEGVGGKNSGFAAPVLPRIKLVLPSGGAPVSVRRRATSTLPPVSKVLPNLIREVGAAKTAETATPPAEPAHPAALPPLASLDAALTRAKPGTLRSLGEVGGGVGGEGGAEARPGRKSRRQKRYDLAFGKTSGMVRQKSGRRAAVEAAGDKAIYAPSQTKPLAKPVFSISPKALAWWFLAPAALFFCLFSWLPIARSAYISFFHTSPLGGGTFVGLDNYARVWHDPLFWSTWIHSGLFCLLSLGLGFWAPVALALYLNEMRRGQSLVRLAFFLPFLTPVVPAIILWRWIFDQGYGLVNSLLAYAGLPNPHIPWLSNPLLAMLAIVVVFLWKNTGWNALIYLTALKGVDEELYDTAEMDGAGVMTRIRQVSLPALKPTMIVLLVMQVLNSLQIFTEVFLMTGGGPANSTEMVATYLYKKSFLYMDIGYASAMSVMLFVALVSFTTFRLRRIEEDL